MKTKKAFEKPIQTIKKDCPLTAFDGISVCKQQKQPLDHLIHYQNKEKSAD
ncbi:hypothetical protein [Enterococcus sp. AZ163]|uniref:hypothetical protein n=1 Tax=Enterococcus sp. AZ163 TaxID=2774638 RepID=UPI003D2E561F